MSELRRFPDKDKFRECYLRMTSGVKYSDFSEVEHLAKRSYSVDEIKELTDRLAHNAGYMYWSPIIFGTLIGCSEPVHNPSI